MWFTACYGRYINTYVLYGHCINTYVLLYRKDPVILWGGPKKDVPIIIFRPELTACAVDQRYKSIGGKKSKNKYTSTHNHNK